MCTDQFHPSGPFSPPQATPSYLLCTHTFAYTKNITHLQSSKYRYVNFHGGYEVEDRIELDNSLHNFTITISVTIGDGIAPTIITIPAPRPPETTAVVMVDCELI